jgi:hypothetical protein
MKLDFKDAEVAQIEIPKSELPQRILQLSLEDNSGQLWASRSLSNKRNSLQIGVERQTDSTGAEFLKLKVIDKEEVPVQTELSVSLIKGGNRSLINPIAKVDKSSFDIARSLRFMEDLLVLTGKYDEDRRHGMRQELPEEIRYDFQKGLQFYGQAYDLNNKLLENTEIQILVTAEEEVKALKTVTDSGGMFTLSGLQIYGEAIMVFRTAGEETEEKLVKVVPYEYEIPPLSSKKKLLQDHSNRTSIEFDRPEGPQDIFNSDMISKKPIALEEVTLVATRELHNTSPDRYDLRATRVIEQNIERPRTIPQLFLNIPGVQVIGLGTLSPQISIPRAAALGPILWVIDGFPLDQTTRLVDIINIVTYTDIKRIELLIGAEASVYGARSAGGVIQIYTRTGSDLEYLARKDAQVVFQGYHNSILFKEYENPVERKRILEDMPVSVLWNPRLPTDKKGETILSLPSSMKDTPLMIEVRAVTEEGKRGELVTFFK